MVGVTGVNPTPLINSSLPSGVRVMAVERWLDRLAVAA